MSAEDRELTRSRELLHGLEHDWQNALAAIVEVHEEERGHTKQRLAAIHKDFKRLGRWQVANSLALLVVVVMGLWLQHAQNTKTDRQAAQNTASLCALRLDLERRVRQSESFLADHPEGFAGIPAGTIRIQVSGQRRTIKALAGLDCG